MASPLPDRAISHRLQIVNIMIYCKSGFDVWCRGVEEAMSFSCPADLIGSYVAVSSLLIMRRMSSSSMIGMELNTNDKQTKTKRTKKTENNSIIYIYTYMCTAHLDVRLFASRGPETIRGKRAWGGGGEGRVG